MKSKLPAVIVSCSMLLLLGGTIIFTLAHSSKPKNAVLGVNSSAANTAATDTGGLAAQNSAANGTALGAVGSDGSMLLQSNFGGDNNSSSSAAPSKGTATAPGPESFKQYDQYKEGQAALFADIVVGTGNEVTATSKVAVTYKGWLTDGTLFDQSKTDDKGALQPFTFQEGAHSVIPGWEQDIVGMKVGGSRRFIVPSAVGYGAKGQGPIPANAVLVFDVQLVAAL